MDSPSEINELKAWWVFRHDVINPVTLTDYLSFPPAAYTHATLQTDTRVP